LLVKIEGLAVTAWESAVYHLPADDQPSYQVVLSPVLPAGQQRHGDKWGIVSLGNSADPARHLPTPVALQMLYTQDPSCVRTFV